jgi:hypothetical protein
VPADKCVFTLFENLRQNLYKWPAQDRAVMVFDFNPDPEGFDRLLLLSKQLLIDGAAWVLLMSESFPMAKIQGKGA